MRGFSLSAMRSVNSTQTTSLLLFGFCLQVYVLFFLAKVLWSARRAMRNETTRLQQHTIDREARRAWQCASLVLCVKAVAALGLVLGRMRRKKVAGGNTFQLGENYNARMPYYETVKKYTHFHTIHSSWYSLLLSTSMSVVKVPGTVRFINSAFV